MATDIVIVDAGGRLFKTTTTTLLSSGSAYFSALLGFTGAALGTLGQSGGNTAAVTPHANQRKRARNDNANDEVETTKEIFVDRDPDLFGDVLHFMRNTRLPAKQDEARHGPSGGSQVRSIIIWLRRTC